MSDDEAAFPALHVPEEIEEEDQELAQARLYLQSVRKEARSLRTKVAVLPKSASEEQTAKDEEEEKEYEDEEEEECLPRRTWVREFESTVLRLREELVQVRGRRPCPQSEIRVGESLQSEFRVGASPCLCRLRLKSGCPGLGSLLSLDQVTVRFLLEEVVGEEEEEESELMWLLGLLLVHEKPVLPETAAAMSRIFRSLESQRKKLCRGERDGQRMALVNMAMVVIARCFRQGRLRCREL